MIAAPPRLIRPGDLIPAAPGLCDCCRSAPADADARYCSLLCAHFAVALDRHEDALVHGTPADQRSTRTALRAMALLFDGSRGWYRRDDRTDWADDYAAGLLDLPYDAALAIARAAVFRA